MGLKNPHEVLKYRRLGLHFGQDFDNQRQGVQAKKEADLTFDQDFNNQRHEVHVKKGENLTFDFDH